MSMLAAGKGFIASGLGWRERDRTFINYSQKALLTGCTMSPGSHLRAWGFAIHIETLLCVYLLPLIGNIPSWRERELLRPRKLGQVILFTSSLLAGYITRQLLRKRRLFGEAACKVGRTQLL